jgi:hypothetical protein
MKQKFVVWRKKHVKSPFRLATQRPTVDVIKVILAIFLCELHWYQTTGFVDILDEAGQRSLGTRRYYLAVEAKSRTAHVPFVSEN